MPKFFYVARDKTGKKISGSEDAANQEELIGRLQSRDLTVVNILTDFKAGQVSFKPEAAADKSKPKRLRYRITSGDLVLFCRQLAILLGSGVTILKSLDIILKQAGSQKFCNIIKNLQKNMEQGLSLHEAMAKHAKVFSELWVNLVESGEASGNLAIVLDRLATYLERNLEFKRKIISALIYPLILLTAALGALVFLMVKVLPMFTGLLQGLNVSLPLLTKILITISNGMRRLFFAGVIGVGILIFLFKKYTQTKSGRIRYEKFLLGLPVFGEFIRAMLLERFSSEMSTLVESGVPILYSLEITEQSVDNLVMASLIRQIKEDVRAGKPLSQPLDRSGFFGPMVVQMVHVGEEIGELSQMFKKINAYYQQSVETFIVRFTSMFEPLMLIFMGGVIGTIVIGMFLPIFQLTKIH
jgi:type IV pilus assembly protein PilC